MHLPHTYPRHKVNLLYLIALRLTLAREPAASYLGDSWKLGLVQVVKRRAWLIKLLMRTGLCEETGK